MYYVYIIQSQRDKSYYIGYSRNPELRLIKHNSSKRGYTSKKQPWVLIAVRECVSKTEALQQEKYLKSMKRIDKALAYMG